MKISSDMFKGIIKENFVVDKLSSKYPEFDSYYKNERNKIKSKIIWQRTDNLPVGIKARTTYKNGLRYLFLEKIPHSFSDAQQIAHELQHIIHDEYYNVPKVGTLSKSPLHNLSAVINSSIQDQMVNRDLLKYNFDICMEFEEEVETSKKELQKMKNEPSDFFGMLHWAINYASNKVDFDFVTSEYEFDDDSFITWFASKYKNATKHGEIVYSQLKTVDLGNYATHIDFYKWILYEYNLYDHIKIISI